jgi:hypothetical protein
MAFALGPSVPLKFMFASHSSPMVSPSSSGATPSPSLGSSFFPLKDSSSGSATIHGSSFHDVVKRNAFSPYCLVQGNFNVVPLSCLVKEALAPSILMRKDDISKVSCLISTMLDGCSVCTKKTLN